jgi:hypothetical protein
MNFYQIRDKKTGLWYKRGPDYGSNWVDQQEASVWTTPAGPNACLGTITRRNRRMVRFGPSAIREPEVVTLIAGGAGKVTFVDGDDWEGLYIDGKLDTEGHHVRIDDLLRLLGIDGQQIYADDAWLAERGNLPENLDEVQRG